MSNRNIPWLLMPMNGIRPDLKERSFLEDFEMPVVLPESHYLPMIPCCLKVLRFVHPNVDLAWLSHAFDLDHDQVASICTMIIVMECVGPSRGVLVEVEMQRDQKALDLRWIDCCHAIALLFRSFAGYGGAGFSEKFHLRSLEWRLTRRTDRMVG